MKCVRLFKPLENEKELVNKKGESKEIRLAGVQFEAESLFTGISKKMIADHLKEVELYKTQSLDFLYDKEGKFQVTAIGTCSRCKDWLFYDDSDLIGAIDQGEPTCDHNVDQKLYTIWKGYELCGFEVEIMKDSRIWNHDAVSISSLIFWVPPRVK